MGSTAVNKRERRESLFPIVFVRRSRGAEGANVPGYLRSCIGNEIRIFTMLKILNTEVSTYEHCTPAA